MLTRKTYLALLAMALVLAMSAYALHFSVGAAPVSTPDYSLEEIDAFLRERGEGYYAYMLLEEANEALHPIILEARWRIISRESWVDDDLNGYIEDENGNIIEIVPHFHDIFPADWEIQPGRSTY